MICPVVGLETYFEVAHSLGIDLSKGFLFRPVLRNSVRERPLLYEATYQRLKHYLSVIGAYQGEITPHSLRNGCAISVRALSSEESSVDKGLGGLMQHIGWSAESSAKHYARIDKMDQARVAHVLSTATLLLVIDRPR
jgi:hypothetical protein